MSETLLHSEHLDLSGNRLHIISEGPDGFTVWLNTDVDDFDGLCIGIGPTRAEAIASAQDLLQEGVSALKRAARISSAGVGD